MVDNGIVGPIKPSSHEWTDMATVGCCRTLPEIRRIVAVKNVSLLLQRSLFIRSEMPYYGQT